MTFTREIELSVRQHGSAHTSAYVLRLGAEPTRYTAELYEVVSPAERVRVTPRCISGGIEIFPKTFFDHRRYYRQ